MTDYTIRPIDPEEDGLLDAIRLMMEQMYSEMSEYGLMLPLAEEGATKWIRGIQPTLGRLSVLMAVLKDDQLIGFAHGSLRFLPDYLGKDLTGLVTHVFVDPLHRKQDLASKLLDGLESWFKEKGVSSIDLQVVEGNEPARKFWVKNGYLPELTQFRKKVK